MELDILLLLIVVQGEYCYLGYFYLVAVFTLRHNRDCRSPRGIYTADPVSLTCVNIDNILPPDYHLLQYAIKHNYSDFKIIEPNISVLGMGHGS